MIWSINLSDNHFISTFSFHQTYSKQIWISYWTFFVHYIIKEHNLFIFNHLEPYQVKNGNVGQNFKTKLLKSISWDLAQLHLLTNLEHHLLAPRNVWAKHYSYTVFVTICRKSSHLDSLIHHLLMNNTPQVRRVAWTISVTVLRDCATGQMSGGRNLGPTSLYI